MSQPTLSRTPSRRSISILRRSNTVTSTAPTRSELLRPHEKQKQAVTAAQHAFREEAERRIHGSQSSSDMRHRLSERNLNHLQMQRRPSNRCPPVQVRQPTGLSSLSSGYPASDDYACSRASSVTYDDPRYYAYEEDNTDAEDYENIFVRRRKSMQWHQENMTPAPRGQSVARPMESETPRPMARDYSPADPRCSTPSSYRRIRKSQSAFVVSPTRTRPPLSQMDDYSSAVFTDERSPRKSTSEMPPLRDNSRRSMSFLRGGSEFLGEGKSRERRSYYMESSQRKAYPLIVPDVGKYKGKNTKGEWGAMRYSMKKKARKISESVFGSMRRVLGISCGDNTTINAVIPEQHITSTRPHFRDYVTVTQEEAFGEREPSIPRRFGSAKKEPAEKPKIRAHYVISKPPTIHLVPSQEMIRSDVGSIREATPQINLGDRKSSATSMGTISTGVWNSTVASRVTNKTIRGHRAGSSPDNDAEYFEMPPKRERYNIDARQVYSALVERLNQLEVSNRGAPVEDGYYMTPGIGLLPSEEGLFEPNSRTGSRPSSLRKKSSDATLRQESEPEYEESQPSSPAPPVPKIPEIYLQEAARRSNHRLQRTKSTCSLKKPAYTEQSPQTPEPTNASSTAVYRRRSMASRNTSFSRPTKEETSARVPDNFPLSTDAALSPCHQQVMELRRGPRQSPSIETLTKGPMDNIQRSPSVLGYRRSLDQSAVDRANTPLGFPRRPLSRASMSVSRTGLRPIDTNQQASPVVGSSEISQGFLKRASRTSLSGRVSRASMREGDAGCTAPRQFGAVSQQVDQRRFLPYGVYSKRNFAETKESVGGDYDKAFL
ncbi:Protein of unknown function [Pyronema omphalodes CBS 100304]|uniref:Uncharacterized protein n=1 Tax=Pyronema omphalodes (strain CBS 100304) TaxID=1076935 RepID=U4LCW9_PYROM|nr:Protein of unknown function [Pyronema omphalodes CBS 100304]